MEKIRPYAWALLAALFLALPARAGDEDVKPAPPPVVEPQEPEPTPFPEEPETPGPELGEEPVNNPEFSVSEPAPSAGKRAAKRAPYDPDKNLDYGELMGMVEPGNSSRGVLPPALGVRGYRPNLVAVGYGDRTPGVGAMLEYSWNRLGAGVFFSYRNLNSNDRYSDSQTFGGFYMLYRWLPFVFSPYLLAGLELGSRTPETFGGMAGLGMEVRIYYGWTVLLGYTYHSTPRKGFLGGAFGWTF